MNNLANFSKPPAAEPRPSTGGHRVAARPLDLFGASVKGPRARNEDRFVVASFGPVVGSQSGLEPRPVRGDRFSVALVADGLGGLQPGDVAASVAARMILARGLRNCYLDEEGGPASGAVEPAVEDLSEEMRQGFHAAHEAVRAEQLRRAARLSTTATAAFFAGRRMVVGHVGDSRCYLLCSTELRLLTEDHLPDVCSRPPGSGGYPAVRFPTRSLGLEDSPPTVDLHELDLRPGDRILLCTDGVSDALADERILHELLAARDAAEASIGLVGAALDAGTEDNATVVVAIVPAADHHEG